MIRVSIKMIKIILTHPPTHKPHIGFNLHTRHTDYDSTVACLALHSLEHMQQFTMCILWKYVYCILCTIVYYLLYIVHMCILCKVCILLSMYIVHFHILLLVLPWHRVLYLRISPSVHFCTWCVTMKRFDWFDMQRATAPFKVVSHSTAVPTQAACTFTVQRTNSLAAPPLDATTVLCINNGEHASSLRLQLDRSLTCTGCGSAPWKQYFFTGNGNWVWSNRFRTFGQSQTWGDNHQASAFALDIGSGGLSRIFQKRNTWTL